jgi:hypothetical protein
MQMSDASSSSSSGGDSRDAIRGVANINESSYLMATENGDDSIGDVDVESIDYTEETAPTYSYLNSIFVIGILLLISFGIVAKSSYLDDKFTNKLIFDIPIEICTFMMYYRVQKLHYKPIDIITYRTMNKKYPMINNKIYVKEEESDKYLIYRINKIYTTLKELDDIILFRF